MILIINGRPYKVVKKSETNDEPSVIESTNATIPNEENIQ